MASLSTAVDMLCCKNQGVAIKKLNKSEFVLKLNRVAKISDKYAADGVDERIDQPLQWVC